MTATANRPRVLFVTSSFPSEADPAVGAFVLEHARGAAAHADVAVLHLDRRHDERRVRVVRDDAMPVPTWRVRYPYRPTPVSVAAQLVAAVAGLRAVRRSGFEPELLHAHFFLAALPASLLSLGLRRPLVATEQWTIFLPEDPAPLTLPLRVGARLALARARLVLPVSESLAAGMRAAGIRGPFRVVPNAVDTAVFHPPAGSPSGPGTRLVTVGLLHRQKGVDVLLEAFAAVRAGRPELRLDVVGDGPERAAYEAQAARLGVAAAVVFHGLRPKPDVAEILRGADLFVLASRFDTFGAVLVEAEATGLPVVATRVGGIPEVVAGDALLVERDDPAALAAAIEEALDRPGFDRAAAAARAADRYSIEAVGRRLADVYAEVLA
jgi:glycosyltransferase involved in cell wall biosynthesis